MAKKITTPEPLVLADWKVGTKKFSENWADTETGKKGSGFYFIRTGSSSEYQEDFNTDDSTKTAITYNRVYFASDEDKERDLPCLQFNGGKPVYDLLPDTVMVNINKEYKGKPFMPIATYKKRIQGGHVIPDATQTVQMDTALKN